MANLFELRLVDPSPVARRLLWHVLSLGRVSRDEPESHSGRDKAGMFLFWVLSGRGVLQVDGARWELSRGPRCWLVDMAQSRAYLPEGKQRLVTSGFRFAGPCLGIWCEALGGPGWFQFSRREEIMQLEQTKARMVRMATRRPVNYEWELHESVTQVLGRLLAARNVLANPVAEKPPRPVTKVLDAVLSDPARAWRAGELAKLAGVSYSGLRSLFRRSQHESLSEFLRRIRLDQARLLLADDRLTVKEIARRLGFSSEFYFSQWFRRLTGASPSHFRENLRENLSD